MKEWCWMELFVLIRNIWNSLTMWLNWIVISCLNFWDEACWSLSLRFFGLLSSSLLLFPNVSANMSSSLLQVFVELGNFHGTSNYVLYWNHGVTCSDSVSHKQVQVLSIPVLLLACSQDWTCNLQMIVFLEAQGTNAYNRYAVCPAGQFRLTNTWRRPEDISTETLSK